MKDYLITFKEKKQICENTYVFYFDTNDSGYSFEAGQYAHFTVCEPRYKDFKGNSRPLSFAGSPHIKGSLMVAARINSSVFIDNLSALSPGDKIYVSKPEGSLIQISENSQPLVFLAGGIGITPFRSIIEFLIHNKYKNKIYLFYSNKTESQTAFLEEFRKWADENDNFIFILTVEESGDENRYYESGFINEKMLKEHIPEISNCHFHIIGPPAMVNSLENILLNQKVNPENIRTEKFN